MEGRSFALAHKKAFVPESTFKYLRGTSVYSFLHPFLVWEEKPNKSRRGYGYVQVPQKLKHKLITERIVYDAVRFIEIILKENLPVGSFEGSFLIHDDRLYIEPCSVRFTKDRLIYPALQTVLEPFLTFHFDFLDGIKRLHTLLGESKPRAVHDFVQFFLESENRDFLEYRFGEKRFRLYRTLKIDSDIEEEVEALDRETPKRVILPSQIELQNRFIENNEKHLQELRNQLSRLAGRVVLSDHQVVENVPEWKHVSLDPEILMEQVKQMDPSSANDSESDTVSSLDEEEEAKKTPQEIFMEEAQSARIRWSVDNGDPLIVGYRASDDQDPDLLIHYARTDPEFWSFVCKHNGAKSSHWDVIKFRCGKDPVWDDVYDLFLDTSSQRRNFGEHNLVYRSWLIATLAGAKLEFSETEELEKLLLAYAQTDNKFWEFLCKFSDRDLSNWSLIIQECSVQKWDKELQTFYNTTLKRMENPEDNVLSFGSKLVRQRAALTMKNR